MTWLRNQTMWEWAGYLGWCFCIYAAYLFGSTLWRGERPSHAKRWMAFVGRWKSRLKERGRAHQATIAYMISLVLLAAMIFGAWMNRGNIVTQHNVVIYGQGENGDWNISSDEHPEGDTFRPCEHKTEDGMDVDGMLKQAIGYIADYAMWDERGTCKSIARQQLGFFFKDRHNNFTYRKAQDNGRR